MKYNRDIYIDPHACKRFLERFTLVKHNGNTEDAMKAAERCLKEIWSLASYLTDDEDGIVFRNKEFDCDMVVQFGRMITVYHCNDRRIYSAKRPKAPVGNSVDDPEDIHVPPQLKKKR